MKKMLVTNALKMFADDVRGSAKSYSEWVGYLADELDKVGEKFALEHNAFRFIAQNIGTEFEFPAPTGEEPNFYCNVHLYPKEGDSTKWTLKLEIIHDEELEDD